jgi:hypothetical protein
MKVMMVYSVLVITCTKAFFEQLILINCFKVNVFLMYEHFDIII